MGLVWVRYYTAVLIMARGRFRDLSRLQLASDDLIALTDALGGREHPIATAILGAVIVEHDLEQLLRAR